MTNGINKVFLLGNLGQDPDVRYTTGGNPVANMSLATGEGYKDKESGQWQERTEWHRIVLFGRMAEIADQYLKKGSRVHIEGKLQTRKWQDRDGNDRFTTEVVANNMIMLGEKEGQGSGYANSRGETDTGRRDGRTQQQQYPHQKQQEEFIDSDIPF